MKKEIAMIVPQVLIPTTIIPVLPPRAGCVNKPGCNNQIIYILPYLGK